MPKVTWVIVVLAFLNAGWLAFDGVYAFTTGDYVTPESGEFAGKLGPWSRLWEAGGMDPRSSVVKGVHVVLGVGWLACAAAFVLRKKWAWRGMLSCAIAGLWYLPFGTLVSVLHLIVLFLPSVRAAFASEPASD